jgi:hypothetical protein
MRKEKIDSSEEVFNFTGQKKQTQYVTILQSALPSGVISWGIWIVILYLVIANTRKYILNRKHAHEQRKIEEIEKEQQLDVEKYFFTKGYCIKEKHRRAVFFFCV